MTNSNLHFEIKGNSENEFIRVGVYGLNFPNAELDWDKNSLKSYAEFKVGMFSGNLELDLMTIDFEKFKRELKIIYDNLNETATFEGIEGNLKIDVKGDGIGHFYVDFFISDGFADGNELNGGIVFDQTQVPELIKQVEKITTEFPTIGKLKVLN